MATEKTSVEIIIEAQNRAAAAIGQAIADQKRLTEELKKAKAAADGSADSNLKVGRTVLAQQEATRRLSQEMAKLQGSTSTVQLAQSQLQQTMQTVTQEIAGQAGGLGRFAAAIGPWGAAIGAGIGVLAALGTAAVNAANQIGDYQEAVDIAAEQTGLTVEQIGGLRVAASNVGRDFESIQPSLSIFVRNIGDAAAGSAEAVKAFEHLGVSVKDQTTGAIRPTGDVLKEVAARLNALPDPAARASAAFDLFGRGAASILPIISQDLTAAEDLAQKLGITLSPAMQKVARDADVAGDKLKLSFMGAMNQLTATLAPAGTAILNFVNGAIENFRKLADFLNEHLLGAFKDLKSTSDELNKQPASNPTVSVGTVSVVNQGPSDQAKELVKQAREQLLNVQRLIPLMDHQRSIGAITAEQEIQKLESMKAQALTARELLTINEKIAGLRKLVPAQLFQGIGPSSQEFEQFQKQQHPFEPELNPLPETQIIEPKVTFDELTAGAVQFLESLEDFPTVLELVTDSTGDVNEALLGFVGTLQRAVLSSLELGQTLAGQVVGAWRTVVHDFITGTGSIGEAFSHLVQNMIETIATQATLRLVGGALGLPLPFAQGGVVYAASGLVTSGVHGKDSTLAMLQPNERVLSVRRNDEFEGLLTKLNGLLTAQASAPQRAMTPQRPNVNVSLTVNGSLADERSLKTLVDERLAPLVGRALATNSVR